MDPPRRKTPPPRPRTPRHPPDRTPHPALHTATTRHRCGPQPPHLHRRNPTPHPPSQSRSREHASRGLRPRTPPHRTLRYLNSHRTRPPRPPQDVPQPPPHARQDPSQLPHTLTTSRPGTHSTASGAGVHVDVALGSGSGRGTSERGLGDARHHHGDHHRVVLRGRLRVLRHRGGLRAQDGASRLQSTLARSPPASVCLTGLANRIPPPVRCGARRVRNLGAARAAGSDLVAVRCCCVVADVADLRNVTSPGTGRLRG